jgi:hypothetical protein
LGVKRLSGSLPRRPISCTRFKAGILAPLNVSCNYQFNDDLSEFK